MKLQMLAMTAMMALAGAAGAVNQCGGQTSSGNPLPCCDNGGNCTWWAWKKAKDDDWVTIPTGNANKWDDVARAQPLFYSVSTTPTVGAVGVKESSPYKCGKTTCDTGHVAYITGIVKDARGNVTHVNTSQMACGGGYGVTTVKRAIGYFDSYITPRRMDGQQASNAACTDGKIVGTATKGSDKVNLYWSNACKTNWAQVIASNKKAVVTAKVVRNSDNKFYSQNGIGSATSAMVSTSGLACASGTVAGVSLGSVCR